MLPPLAVIKRSAEQTWGRLWMLEGKEKQRFGVEHVGGGGVLQGKLFSLHTLAPSTPLLLANVTSAHCETFIFAASCAAARMSLSSRRLCVLIWQTNPHRTVQSERTCAEAWAHDRKSLEVMRETERFDLEGFAYESQKLLDSTFCQEFNATESDHLRGPPSKQPFWIQVFLK